ncbi:hypothetical protein HIM_11487 [Hirsutella minnesotensis 3608]|uniref:Uncharacterized protein n=1 Tax=Hirsutella minnesotensis 3608 TaxID=1043627 RepID=A0A0F8A140_9HYPO|nr:hypothetical protein HIM_11487 [Hirsutella minnesotensis 3608]
MSDSHSVPTSPPSTVSWILRVVEENERTVQAWTDYVDSLASENDQHEHTIRKLERDKKHNQECDLLQEQMIKIQSELIQFLKEEMTASKAQTNALSDGFYIDPKLTVASPYTVASENDSPDHVEASQPAQLLLELAASEIQ